MTGAVPVGRFPPAQRLQKRLEFQTAQSAGRKAILPHFVLLLYARAESGEARLGIVASRRVGTAVIRNRAKRLVREAFRATRHLFMPESMSWSSFVGRSKDEARECSNRVALSRQAPV